MTESGPSDDGLDVLVIDGANVVGSRPDGWWNDRARAAARLHEELMAAELPAELIVLVLEGRARSGVGEGQTGSVRVVHAIGEGDDAIVAETRNWAGRRVAVVSADRGLLARVAAAGAGTRRPGWLLAQL